ncbi:hypothetical protein C8R47DRAFT_249949 [Mycena vitilis]|nr:hypothetical protein C8R47DRAFT_249949 [Mycena vitilis]
MTTLRVNSYLVQSPAPLSATDTNIASPARGTLFPTRTEAVGTRCLQWMSLNLMLFLLPLLSGLLAVCVLGDRLGFYKHQSPLSLAFTLTYFAISSGAVNVFIGK